MLAYTSQPYAEAMAMRPTVSYAPYTKSTGERAGDIITFVQFEEVNLWSETHEDVESGDKPDDDLIMPPLIS